MSLTEFLLARIAEDGADCADLAAIGASLSGPPYWTATRYLAECEAKRRIVEDLSPLVDYDRDTHIVMAGTESVAAATLYALALPYADHPDYREEWKP